MSDLFGNHIVGFPTRRLKRWLCCHVDKLSMRALNRYEFQFWDRVEGGLGLSEIMHNHALKHNLFSFPSNPS